MRSRRGLVLLPTLLVATALAVSACGDGGGSTAGSDGTTTGSPTQSVPPVVVMGDGPQGATAASVGGVTIQVPPGLTRLDHLPVPKGQQILAFAGEQDANGQAAAAQVTVAEKGTKTPQQEAESFAGLKRDVHKATDVTVSPLTWDGFTSAYGISYTDAPQATGLPGQKGLMFVGSLPSGATVVASVKAPPEQFDQLQLQQMVASLRVG